MFTKQKRDYSSAVQQARLLSSNVFSSKEKRGLSPSLRPKSTEYIYRNDSFQNGKSYHFEVPFTRPRDYMINIDLTDANLSVPIHQDSQSFLRFMWQNKPYQFKAQPFGLNVAPRVFTKLLKSVVAWLRGQGIRLIIYLDDILIMAASADVRVDSPQTNNNSTSRIIGILDKLRVVDVKSYSKDSISRSFKTLGKNC